MKEELIKEYDRLQEEIYKVMETAVNSEEFVVWQRLGYLQGSLDKVKAFLDYLEDGSRHI